MSVKTKGWFLFWHSAATGVGSVFRGVDLFLVQCATGAENVVFPMILKVFAETLGSRMCPQQHNGGYALARHWPSKIIGFPKGFQRVKAVSWNRLETLIFLRFFNDFHYILPYF